MSNIIQTDYNELLRFAKAMTEFSDEIAYQINSLAKETESVTEYSWRGRKASEFLQIVLNAKEDLLRQTYKMNDLSVEVKEKGEQLKAANERRF